MEFPKAILIEMIRILVHITGVLFIIKGISYRGYLVSTWWNLPSPPIRGVRFASKVMTRSVLNDPYWGNLLKIAIKGCSCCKNGSLSRAWWTPNLPFFQKSPIKGCLCRIKWTLELSIVVLRRRNLHKTDIQGCYLSCSWELGRWSHDIKRPDFKRSALYWPVCVTRI